ncbi:MAG: hypothetical protein CSB06_01325 [Bacteroidia bacterium]|nr:MAG: hypothetical protein CSB06_01325 [Bacteroidia bacterium]
MCMIQNINRLFLPFLGHTVFLRLLLIFSSATAQNIDYSYFEFPLRLPIRLAGNFAEVRPNHFHSGLDIKAPSGTPVYAPADGYLSRIRKSGGGYGNALYITHPNGLRTVYGHLLRFKDELEAFAEKIQYRNNSFDFTEYPDSARFPIKKGDIIGYVGNTGSSSGPHLHFEIRTVEKDVPINPLLFRFKVKDSVKPRFKSLLIYKKNPLTGETEKKIYPVLKGKDRYYISETIDFDGQTAVAFEAYDYMNDVRNTQGIYSIRMFVDQELYYEHRLDSVAFEDTRYINSFVDYEQYLRRRKAYIKCFIEPGNKLPVYRTNRESGIITAADKQIHTVKIIATDNFNNSITLSFQIKGTPSEWKLFRLRTNRIFPHNKDNFFVKDSFACYIDRGTLYTDIKKVYTQRPRTSNLYSARYSLCSPYVPLHKPVYVLIHARNIPKNYKDKALMVRLTDKGGRRALPGRMEDDYIVAKSKSLGVFALTLDTLPPQIKRIKHRYGTNYTRYKKIAFKITDNLSGVTQYTATLDGKPLILTHDAKTSKIYYIFDRRITKNTRHQLIITASDAKNNTTHYTCSFFK